jgi:hypothetical protein
LRVRKYGKIYIRNLFWDGLNASLLNGFKIIPNGFQKPLCFGDKTAVLFGNAGVRKIDPVINVEKKVARW